MEEFLYANYDYFNTKRNRNIQELVLLYENSLVIYMVISLLILLCIYIITRNDRQKKIVYY